MDTSATFLPNLLRHCYRNQDSDGEEEEVRPRRLATLLMLLAIGSVVETKDRSKGIMYVLLIVFAVALSDLCIVDWEKHITICPELRFVRRL